MAAKVPIRTVYTNSVATGLAEFQSGEFIDYAVGGTGLAALGSAGQVLKVNSGASALEYGNVEAVLNIDGMTDGSGITIVDADKFAVTGTGTTSSNSAVLKVPFFARGNLSTKNAEFEFNATLDNNKPFLDGRTFTLADGSTLANIDAITIFQL